MAPAPTPSPTTTLPGTREKLDEQLSRPVAAQMTQIRIIGAGSEEIDDAVQNGGSVRIALGEG